jgi:hypothetical protein
MDLDGEFKPVKMQTVLRSRKSARGLKDLDQSSPHRHPVQRPGMALLVVLVLVMMVSLSAYGFTWMMQNQYRLTRIQEDQAQARLAALSGIEWVSAILQQPAAERLKLGDLTNNPAIFHQIQVEELPTSSANQQQLSAWRFSVLSPRSVETSDTAVRPQNSMQDSQVWEAVNLGLQSESAKIHLPTLAAWDAQFPGHARQVLSSLPGATEDGVQAWLNQLRQSSSGRLAQHQWAGLWLGDDLNRNYRMDPIELWLRSGLPDAAFSESSRLDSQSQPVRATAQDYSSAKSQGHLLGWQQYLTWHSGERNQSMTGRPRIYLNQPDLRSLHRQLTEIWTAEWANFVIAYRQYGPVVRTASSDRASESSARAERTPAASVPEPNFAIPSAVSIRSPLELIGASIRVPSANSDGSGDAGNSLIHSPFRDEITSASDYLRNLLDDVTVQAQTSIEGRIDISQAPLLVLLSVPGMQQELAEQIVQRRLAAQPVGRSLGDDQPESSSRLTIAWLLEEGIVNLPKLVQLERYLTSRSDVYSCQIIGYKDNDHAVYRSSMIVDARTPQPMVRDYQTWHEWDRGFDIDSLGSPTIPAER